MRFFADNNVPVAVAHLLNAYDDSVTVEHLSAHFATSTKDTDWIPAVSAWEPMPAVISGDAAILTKPDEALALRESGLSWFVLKPAWTNQPFAEWKWKAVRAFGHMIAAVDAVQVPTVFEVPISANAVSALIATHHHEPKNVRKRGRNRRR